MPRPKELPSRRRSALLKQAKQLLQQEPRNLWWYHQLGSYVNELRTESDQSYGVKTIKTLAGDLGLTAKSAPELLWCARKFAVEYTTQDLAKLVGHRSRKPDGPLTWRHMCALLAIKDDRRLRNSLTQACIKGQWSVSHLRRKIQQKKGFPPEGGGRINRPHTLDEALQQFMEVSRAWLRRYHKVWFGKAGVDATGEPPVIRPEMRIEDHTKVPKLVEQAIAYADDIRKSANEAKRTLERLSESL